ncbi:MULTISPECIES: 3-phosphoserine/phosphohydroxythreonine transaminase [Pedobacter]|uniref:Phosphoserine aminotransferase n=1 Tax=Pedobacter heparinus (strain ATCC 13125 / DSM 2366 / CIP 104194 / JCM 7457 / NBRC 12017 / NCIMB 9290 / NRRL B-14731 / HIM 762-3) TaxID=485917 RepID=C6XVY6_PEDHD|nr:MULTISPECIES: 3-phosphoserine/phosphohydroxythreonine transaminase [Pedobacter]ACU04065.1 phosphoserine aminotransferase [Pedobacter heparinus DSM 2366]MBB5436482.1 phosphoserine aminotransferase [Pedobacter sp. AK017]
MRHNFGAGPCILPQEVFKQASQAVLDFKDGLSILEISHRTPEFEAVVDETVKLVKELMNVPSGYSVVLLQGGASLQFAMVPMNLLPQGGTAAYLETGVWANKAIKEVKTFGTANIVASSKADNFTFVPKDYTIPEDSAYFHCTSNNTIYGTELFSFPETSVPLVCDMSSDIMSRVIDVSKFDLIYAGAQKNIGPAGLTIAIVKDEILGKSGRSIPSMLDYKVHIDGGSMYNTPPVFSIYVAMLNLRWLKSKGGVAEIEKENIAKAKALYAEIDRNPLFKGTCAVEDRSRMNICFVMENPELEKPFLKFAEENGVEGIKGHRSVGGFRASMYNALPITSVHALIELMQIFAEKHQ